MNQHPQIDAAIRRFSEFLRTNWELVRTERGGDFEDWWCDWTQANWELLVEAAVPWTERVRMEVYGDGADCHPSSSRVTLPEATATHRLVCVPSGQLPLKNELRGSSPHGHSELVFDRFVALDGTWYREAPPFDMVLAHVDDEPVVFALHLVRLSLIPLE
jgi:hypothetical protein